VSVSQARQNTYTSIGRELAKDGKLLDGLTLPVMLQYFSQYPAELSNYLPRNRGFVFFSGNLRCASHRFALGAGEGARLQQINP